MKIGELAQRIHVHRVHAWRLAKAGVIPATKKTKGGHFYFVECPALTRWINFMIGGAFRRKEMARAYKCGYGGVIPGAIEEERRLRRAWKEVQKLRKEHGDYTLGYHEIFRSFFSSTEDLIKVLEEITEWRKCKLKADLLKTSRERLTVLRDLLAIWLSGDRA
jgi:hypothetical protein